jgi:uncharacterized SAM-binding protein YcdF (DUF218 family)
MKRLRRIGPAVLVSLAAWQLVAWGAANALVVTAELPRADALVVLSGSGSYEERTHLAAELFAAGRAPLVLLTNDGGQGGWSEEEQRNPPFVELEEAELVRSGVPAERVEKLMRPVGSTFEEAVLLREQAEARGLRSLVVVTSPYHSRRALWTLRRVFRGSGIELGLYSPPAGQQSPRPFTWWLHPMGWRAVAAEYPKLVYYWLNY